MMRVDQIGISDDTEQERVLLVRSGGPGSAIDEVDLAVLTEFEEVRQEGEPDLVVELIDLYLQDAPRQLKTITAALETTDKISLKRAAHTLKGSSASLGIRHVAEICEKLGQPDCYDSPQRVEGLVQLLAHRFAKARLALAAERQRRLA